MIRINDYTGQREFITSAVIKSISPTVRKLNNEKETPWQRATAEITYPSGRKHVIGATLFTGSLKAYPKIFVVGQTVDIAIQLDGEHAGKGKLQLPTLKIADVKPLLTGIEKNNDIKKIEKIDSSEEEKEITEFDFNNYTSLSKNKINKNYVDNPKEKGCITILTITVSLLIIIFIFKGGIKYIGSIAYPILGISGYVILKIIESLWFDNKK